MKDEKETLRKTADSIHVMEKFDPAILADVTAPVVSLYIPVHHTEREERRDIWDRDMFKDLMKDAERTLAETYDKDAYKGIVEKADYLCLRDVSLSWSLPKAWLRKLHISDVTLTVSGNTLRARGDGTLNLQINPRSNVFEMYGDYTITEGSFLFSLQNIINKRFIIENGSTIQWTGEPLDARLNINAVYKLKTSLQPLIGTSVSSGGGDMNLNRAVPVE